MVGLWAGRRRILEQPERHRTLLRVDGGRRDRRRRARRPAGLADARRRPDRPDPDDPRADRPAARRDRDPGRLRVRRPAGAASPSGSSARRGRVGRRDRGRRPAVDDLLPGAVGGLGRRLHAVPARSLRHPDRHHHGAARHGAPGWAPWCWPTGCDGPGAAGPSRCWSGGSPIGSRCSDRAPTRPSAHAQGGLRDDGPMRAIMFESFNGPVEVRDVADPEPPPGGVVVEVHATGLCRSDWHAWAGHDAGVGLPHVPGHELCGVVAATGAGVTRWRAGDRVTAPFVCGCGRCEWCRSGQSQVCPDQTQPGFTHWGSFAEYVVLHAADTNLVEVPSGVTDGAAASLGCRFATSYRALTGRAALREGEWLDGRRRGRSRAQRRDDRRRAGRPGHRGRHQPALAGARARAGSRADGGRRLTGRSGRRSGR